MNAMALGQDRVRCRPILATDIEAILALLQRGFPGRPESYWRRGLSRMAKRQLPEDLPRFGFLLECKGRLVGVLLLLFSRASENGADITRCNLSSWYVEEAFRAHATQLVMTATRRKDVTFTNISAARHTWSSVEAQGFRRFSDGLFFTVPILGRKNQALKVHAVASGAPMPPVSNEDRDRLATHAAYGCICLIVETQDSLYPFIFLPFRIRSGQVWLPAAHLIYCRAPADFSRFARVLAWALLKRGAPIVIVDASDPMADLRGFYRPNCRPKYMRGPNTPRLCDHAYSELAFFGP